MTATKTLPVRTMVAHSTAHVTLDFLEAVPIVLMLMNVMIIHAITMEHAQTQLEATSALVIVATLEMEPTVRTLMSVTDTMSIVMLMQTAQIFMDLIIVSAKTVTQEMELIAVM